MRTLEAFYDYNAEIRIILVLPHSQQDYWRQLCREYRFSLPHAIADGGDAVPLRKERFGFGQDTCFGRCARWGASVRGREVIARCYDLLPRKYRNSGNRCGGDRSPYGRGKQCDCRQG